MRYNVVNYVSDCSCKLLVVYRCVPSCLEMCVSKDKDYEFSDMPNSMKDNDETHEEG